MTKVLLTGSSGFIGTRLTKRETSPYCIESYSLRQTNVEELDFTGIDSIVHLAGIAHRLEPTPDQLYFDINHTLTTALAKRAKSAGVGQFVFMSTIKVYGEQTGTAVITEKTLCHPEGAYARSKWVAEQDLLRIADDTFRVSIIRTPVVYGPGVKGNLLRIMLLASKPIPLPFANIENKRSMIFVDNLVALLDQVIQQKASGIFLPADHQALSTSTLLRIIRLELGVKEYLFHLPGIGRRLLRKLKPSLYSRLFDSLLVDGSQTNARLDFTPPFASDHGIREMVKWFKAIQ